MEKKKFDATKPCQTRDGQLARIYAVDGEEPYPIHGAYLSRERNSGWVCGVWRGDGQFVSEGDTVYDLVNGPEQFRFEVFLNVYSTGTAHGYSSYAEANKMAAAADKMAASERIACLRMEVKGLVGDGLNGSQFCPSEGFGWIRGALGGRSG